jgi:dTDP-4-dehydrorhamnose reductase
MKKILITGANGLLGQALVDILKDQYVILASGVEEESVHEVPKIKYTPLDISNLRQCRELINQFVPDVIVNAASFTQVDACEDQKELCWQVNVKGVENLANLARRYDVHLIHYSTDYIFDGKKGPYAEDDRSHPLGYYGKSKLASENVLRQIACPFTIVRTCVIYGLGSQVKKNFYVWILENLKGNKSITVVTDQYNNPTLAEDLARGSEQIIRRGYLGSLHLAGKQYLNRFDFAVSVAKFFELDSKLVQPIETVKLKQASPRPEYGGLKIDKAIENLSYEPRSIEESFIFLKWKMGKNGR